MHSTAGYLQSRRVYDIASELLIGGSDYTYDNAGRVIAETTVLGDTTSTLYNCCGPRFVTAPDNSVTEYAYDAFNRQVWSSSNGITYLTTYDAAGKVIESTMIGKDGGELTTRNEYDSESRLMREFDAANIPISYYYGLRYTELADIHGGSIVVENYLDGRTKSVNGPASYPQSYKYGIENGELYTLEGSAGDKTVKTYTDFLGRDYKRVFADGFTEIAYYDSYGRLSSQVNSEGKKLLYFYDDNTGSLKYQVLKRFNNSNDIDWANDRIVEFEHGYSLRDDIVVKYQKTFMYKNNRKIEISSSESNLKNTERWITEFEMETHIEKETGSDGTTVEKITKPDGNVLTNHFINGKLVRKTDPVIGNVEYIYDEFYRYIGEDREVNGESVNIRHTLNKAGTPLKITQSSSNGSRDYLYTYDRLGRMLSETTPGGITRNYTYTVRGQVAEISGGAYYQQYRYDTRGRVTSLVTVNEENHAQVTTFDYDIHGRVTRKIYPNNATEEYTYLGDGRIATRTNAQKHVHHYHYNYAGELMNIHSEAGLDRSFEYNQYGRLVKVADICGDCFMTYDDSGRLISEVPPHLNGLGVGWSYDAYQRPATLSMGASVLASYDYGADGRLSRITHGNKALEYSYVPGLYQVKSKNWQNSFQHSEYFYDNFARLMEIQSNGLPEVSYQVNPDDLRTSARVRNSYQWDYTYDAVGQLIDAKQKNMSDDILSSLSYSYDGIGNRTYSSEAGTEKNYLSNPLNQYMQVEDISNLQLLNSPIHQFSNSPIHQLTYDADGNMLSNGDWTYHWDTENRLVGAENEDHSIEYVYDYMGRMIIRKQFAGPSENRVLEHTEKYLYDGWNRIGEFNADNELTRSYLWGNDVSGFPQGAGGIGGLLAEINQAGDIYLPVYDGNGNITSYLEAETGEVVADYAYSPFGDSPNSAVGFKHRFSTKVYDELAGIYYYGLRHYDPVLGRWLSRDPIGENGGLNLYAMVANNPVNHIDPLGEALYAFDGTANWEGHYTNVSLMHDVYQSENKHYYRGIGNEVDYNWRSERIIIQAWGLTIDSKVEAGLKDLRDNLNGNNPKKQQDCEIDIVGFSRGSITAVRFIKKIAELKRANDPVIRKVSKIRFAGLFDPVEGGLRDASYERMDSIVAYACVAYSINEERDLFAPTYYTGSNVNALFFYGGHADIGGGYADRGLADITLEWMVVEGKAAGAPFELDDDFYPRLYSKWIYEDKMWKPVTEDDPRHQEMWFYSTYSPRKLPQWAQYHYSVGEYL